MSDPGGWMQSDLISGSKRRAGWISKMQRCCYTTRAHLPVTIAAMKIAPTFSANVSWHCFKQYKSRWPVCQFKAKVASSSWRRNNNWSLTPAEVHTGVQNGSDAIALTSFSKQFFLLASPNLQLFSVLSLMWSFSIPRTFWSSPRSSEGLAALQ